MKELIFDKLKSKLALLFMLIIMISSQYWLFGFLFLIWVVVDLINKETHLLETITLKDNPILYTLILLSWLAFAILSLMTYKYY